MENEDFDSIFITQEETGQRLDKILAARYHPVQSRTYFQFLIQQHRILVNGEFVKKRHIMEVGDEVQIHFILTPEIGLKPEPIPLDVIYEDQEILVVNKPAGMVVHPAPGNWTGTFVNAFLFHCQDLLHPEILSSQSPSFPRPGIVHRLDKETSGLLVAAKTSFAQQRLIELFANRQVYKEYLTVCVGNPGEGEIRLPIGRHTINRKQMTVQKEEGKGRQAITIYKTLKVNDSLSLVSIILATGRTHQIRVHMKYLGTPVLGDSLYGQEKMNKKYGVKRQLLHAYQLRFQHPISKKLLEFKAPIPKDMADFISHYFG